VLLAIAPVWPHADLERQIEAITERLSSDPENAALYLRRAELHRLHGDGSAARVDLARTRRLDPALAGVDLSLGRLWLGEGRPDRAVDALGRFLDQQPDSSDGLALRARARMELGRHASAVEDFDAAILHHPSPGPDLYLLRSRALQAAGTSYRPAALEGLEAGLRSTGGAVLLELEALELERALGRFDAALIRIDRLAAASPRPESWLIRRGEVLEAGGRAGEAAAAYRGALAAMAELPPGRRDSPGVTKLAEQADSALVRLSSSREGGAR